MDLSAEIEYFFTHELPPVAAVERTKFDAQVEPGSPIVVYGCGNLGRKLARGLQAIGQSPVSFVDGNDKLWGSKVEGLPVYSPAEGARVFGRTSVLVITIWSAGKDRRFATLLQQMTECGFKKVVHFLPLFWKHAEILLPHYRLDLPSRMLDSKREAIAAFDLLEDVSSKIEYLVQLRWMLSPDPSSIAPGEPIEDTYFSRDLIALGVNERFIDCGAFDGDTLKEFLKRTNLLFDQIVAYEPDPQNYQRLQQYVESLPESEQIRIRLEKYALGASPGIVRFEAMGSISSSILASGSIEVQRNTLDETLKGIAPTYVKMDIEGAELDALQGGVQTIQEHHPKLAVCVYHTQAHLWEIPLRIKELNPLYRLYLRRYDDEFGDVVCYAVT
jgi:FkbM family methyltransferase